MDKTWFPWEIDASQSLEMHADCKVWPILGWALWKSKLNYLAILWESWKLYEKSKANILLFKRHIWGFQCCTLTDWLLTTSGHTLDCLFLILTWKMLWRLVQFLSKLYQFWRKKMLSYLLARTWLHKYKALSNFQSN